MILTSWHSFRRMVSKPRASGDDPDEDGDKPDLQV